jgi:hypothetical protein
VSNRVSRRQANRWASQNQQAYEQQAYQQQAYQQPPPQAEDTTDRLAQLEQLGKLRDQGVLTDAEFEQQKNRILNG